MDYYIFGAHSRAYTVKEYLCKLEPNDVLLGFLYDDEDDNPKEIDGIPVLNINLSSEEQLNLNASVFLGIRGTNFDRATSNLIRRGFKSIIPVTVELDNKLRNDYLKMYFSERGKKFRKIDDYSFDISDYRDKNTEGCIYVVSSAFDATLNDKHNYLPFERIIQVGTVLANSKIKEAVYDDEDDNISYMNRQFCELTALYWIWKNVRMDYVGIEHYRRFFSISDNIFDIMKNNKIDVILPVPLCVMPSLKDNYLFRHMNKPWNDMLSIINNLYPDEYNNAITFFEESIYSPCNMMIARKEVYDHLCEWMFPILFEVSKLNGEVSDRYQNRYPGFMSERLISFFFEENKEKYKMVYADKVFLN